MVFAYLIFKWDVSNDAIKCLNVIKIISKDAEVLISIYYDVIVVNC